MLPSNNIVWFYLYCLLIRNRNKNKHNNNKKIRKKGLYCRQNDIQTITFMQVQILIQINKAHYMHSELYNAHWVIKYLTNNKGFTKKHLDSNITCKIKNTIPQSCTQFKYHNKQVSLYFKLQNNKKYNKRQTKLYDLNTKSY